MILKKSFHIFIQFLNIIRKYYIFFVFEALTKSYIRTAHIIPQNRKMLKTFLLKVFFIVYYILF